MKEPKTTFKELQASLASVKVSIRVKTTTDQKEHKAKCSLDWQDKS